MAAQQQEHRCATPRGSNPRLLAHGAFSLNRRTAKSRCAGRIRAGSTGGSWSEILFGMFLSLVALTQTLPQFGGEDPVLGNPWHHEVITREAAESVGFSGPAADDL